MRCFFVCCTILTVAFSPACLRAEEAKTGEALFRDQVEPILRRRCYSCHSVDKQEGGLRLDTRRKAIAGGDTGAVIVPGKAKQSRLIALIKEATKGERMPPKGELLSKQEVAQITRWIDEGATWPQGEKRSTTHWAFQPIASPSVPAVRMTNWPNNPIDQFVLRKLEQERTHPSKRASRQILIRRLFLDTLGLPPTPEQWKRWMSDPNPDWYRRLVDELLASPHFAERWARVWLDNARYADSDGYEKDRPRPHAYQWRDWVLSAINRDVPYDQFTELQIAGDLIPGATAETRLATGFHRNTLTNREGGIDKEEDRVKQTVDRVNTMATVWLGLTVRCAQCHSHKYDPISQREYYGLYAFFNNADEKDIQLPPTDEQQRAYEKAKRDHDTRLAQLAIQFNLERQAVVEHLEQTIKEYRQRYSSGNPQELKKHLAIHLPFDVDLRTSQGKTTGRFSKGTPQHADGRIGKCLVLNGSDQRVELGGPLKFTSSKSFTIAAWVRHVGGVGSIVTKMDESADFRGVDFTSNQGMLEVHLVHKWPSDAIKVTTKSRLKLGAWQHVMMTYDGSKKAAGVQIYINGNRQQLTTHFDQLRGDIDIEQPLRVGSRRTGTFFKGAIDDVRVYTSVIDEPSRKLLAGDEGISQFLKTAAVPIDRRTPKQTEMLIDFVGTRRPGYAKLKAAMSAAKRQSPTVQRGTAMTISASSSPRRSFVHIRGNFLKKGKEVSVGTPSFLPPLPARGDKPDRLDLARWIINKNNPLTSRVAVNRVWQHYFGHGLVLTSDDFGSQGEAPSHPELLDFLARRLMNNGWSMKWLHRELLLSATYQQSSTARPDLAVRDPNNRWLARRERSRVDAETVRDLALATSGLLDNRTHGPSVFPPLPPGVIELAFVDVINRGPWKVSNGSDRYRRGLYTFFQRTAPYPLLALFDAPDSNATCTRRPRSNTPLQALMIWNDPVFQECSRVFARRIINEAEGESQRVRLAFVAALSREPSPEDRDDILTLLRTNRRLFAAKPKLARQLIGNTAFPEEMSVSEAASWVGVARTILNLDEFITRE